MLALRDWQNFYMLTGGAGATLIGLLFVAVSVGTNLPRKQTMGLLRTFVSPILLYYVQVLLISFLAVMPLENTLLYSVAALVLGMFNIFLTLKVLWRILVVHRDQEIDGGHWIWHICVPLIVGVLFLVISFAVFLNQQIPAALLALAIADILCLAIGLRNTWTLMLWLLLHREQPQVALEEAEKEKTYL